MTVCYQALQGLVECDASVSTAGLNTQLSATRAMLTAHKHPVIAVFEEVRVHTHTHTLTDLSYLHYITFVPLPLFLQLAGQDLSSSEKLRMAGLNKKEARKAELAALSSDGGTAADPKPHNLN